MARKVFNEFHSCSDNKITDRNKFSNTETIFSRSLATPTYKPFISSIYSTSLTCISASSLAKHYFTILQQQSQVHQRQKKGIAFCSQSHLSTDLIPRPIPKSKNFFNKLPSLSDFLVKRADKYCKWSMEVKNCCLIISDASRIDYHSSRIARPRLVARANLTELNACDGNSASVKSGRSLAIIDNSCSLFNRRLV